MAASSRQIGRGYDYAVGLHVVTMNAGAASGVRKHSGGNLLSLLQSQQSFLGTDNGSRSTAGQFTQRASLLLLLFIMHCFRKKKTFSHNSQKYQLIPQKQEKKGGYFFSEHSVVYIDNNKLAVLLVTSDSAFYISHLFILSIVLVLCFNVQFYPCCVWTELFI